jgi:uncharacterized protein YndB with AHSA1/START domain
MPGWDGLIEGKVLEADEPHRLAYSWKGTRARRIGQLVEQLTYVA